MSKHKVSRLVPLLLVLLVVGFALAVPAAYAQRPKAVVPVTLEDNYGFIWHLKILVDQFLSGRIVGRVTTIDCGTWAVVGSFQGRSFTLRAINPGYDGDCAKWFVYEGTWSGGVWTGLGSGSWHNSAGLSGEFTIWLIGIGSQPIGGAGWQGNKPTDSWA